MFQNKMITNESTLSVDMIGEDGSALICTTTKNDCCKAEIKYGEWYYPGGQKVGIKGTGMSSEAFYRTRDVQQVLLHKHNNIVNPETGMFCCEVPDSDDNCGINQTMCVNLGKQTVLLPVIMLMFELMCMLYGFHLAGSLTFNESGSKVAGENYTLRCIARVSSIPTFIWSGPHGSIDQTSISYGIILNEAESISDSQYMSSIEFTPLKASHEGKYTCKISSPESSIDMEVTANGLFPIKVM